MCPWRQPGDGDLTRGRGGGVPSLFELEREGGREGGSERVRKGEKEREYEGEKTYWWEMREGEISMFSWFSKYDNVHN